MRMPGSVGTAICNNGLDPPTVNTIPDDDVTFILDAGAVEEGDGDDSDGGMVIFWATLAVL
jgi:hypothetical protein